MSSFEVVIAVYGVQDASGDVLTEQAAQDVYRLMREKVQHNYITPDGYMLLATRMEQGRVYATLTKEQDERERLAQVFGTAGGKSLSEMIIEDRGE